MVFVVEMGESRTPLEIALPNTARATPAPACVVNPAPYQPYVRLPLSAERTTHATSGKVSVKVLNIALLGPPVVTFPHPNLEVYFEVSIARAPQQKGAQGYGRQQWVSS